MVRSQGRACALVPLGRARLGASTKWTLLGSSPFHGEPTVLLHDGSSDALVGVARGLLSLGQALLIPRLVLDDDDVRVLQQVSLGRALTRVTEAKGSPWLRISGDWPAFEAGQSSQRRSDVRRARRRAERMGELSCEVLAPGPRDALEHIASYYAVEAAGWKGLQADPQQVAFQRFFVDYGRAVSELGVLRVAKLRIDGQLVAAQLAVEHSNRYWILQIGHDQSFDRCSPGIVLMDEIVRDAFRRRLHAVEFLGGDAPWIHTWTRTLHAYRNLQVYPFSIRGMAALGADAAARTSLGARQRMGQAASA